MIPELVKTLNQLVDAGSYSGSGKFGHRGANFKIEGKFVAKHEVVFIPVQPGADPSDGGRGEFVFHFASDAQGRLLMALKLFSNARETKYKEIGFAILGNVEKRGRVITLVRNDCRYPFEVDLPKLILHSCGIGTEYDDSFLRGVECVKVYVKEITEVK